MIKLSLDSVHPSGQAEFDINTFGHKWVFVPFGLDLPIKNVACEGAVISGAGQKRVSITWETAGVLDRNIISPFDQKYASKNECRDVTTTWGHGSAAF